MYADFDFYVNNFGGDKLTAENAGGYLSDASTKVDILTFCRIGCIGFSNLTPFQQEKVRSVVCRLAEFLCENEDILASYIASYSINGVSIDLRNSVNLSIVEGVVIPSSLYAELVMTGLCRRGF